MQNVDCFESQKKKPKNKVYKIGPYRLFRELNSHEICSSDSN